ncbi:MULTISPECIES: hypothetical protein [unclassified Micromonospora]|uniref:hypothetical protein n=1 Tax=unclassified Micromonospora TaxID=2617518 RepID=UPI00249ACE7D|nr:MULTISPECIES: hypothetical protein [unclassified Micromonospora]WFE54811.1 hypothetical protein O7617_32615 [Micromonospora sp. WMMD1155]WFE98667.1 hypothetical protein O7616_17315 [Micromonospora sp. WMMD964]
MTARPDAHGGPRDSARTRYVAGLLALAAVTVLIFVGAGRLPSGVQTALGFSVIFFVGALVWLNSSQRRRSGADTEPARAATATLNVYGIALVAALVGYYLLRDQDWAWVVGLLPAAVCLVSAARVTRG